MNKLFKKSYKSNNKTAADIDDRYYLDPGLSTDKTKVYVDKNTNDITMVNRGTSDFKDVMTDAKMLFGYNDKRFNEPKEILVVVSNNDESPYFNQIYDFFNATNTTLDKLRLKDLTLEKVNAFSQGDGYMIVFALDTEEEYNTFGALIKSSDYKKQVHCIECTQPTSQGINDLQSKVSDIQTSSSGVSINGTGYVGLNTLIAYEKCAAALTLTWKCWCKFKEGSIIDLPK